MHNLPLNYSGGGFDDFREFSIEPLQFENTFSDILIVRRNIIIAPETTRNSIKVIAFSIILCFLLSSIALASPGETGKPLTIFAPPSSLTDNSGYYFALEGLFIKPTSNTDFAVEGGGTPSGKIFKIGFDRKPGYRFSLGKNLPNKAWDVGATITYIKSDQQESINGTLGPTLLPPALSNDSVTFADARSEFQLTVVDLLARYNIKIAEDFRLGFATGIKLANIYDTLDATYSGGDCSVCFHSSEVDFIGAGPQFKTEAGWEMSKGLKVWGDVGISLLAGVIDFLRVDTEGTTSRRLESEDNTRLISVIEMRTGIDWFKQVTRRIRIQTRIGYEFQEWFDFVDQNNLVQSSFGTPSNLQDVSSNIGFEGPFVQLRLEF